jgi:arylsulfatase A-like enzyme
MLSGCGVGEERPARPNILFIMADDHTTQAISCYGGIFADKAKTVNVDRIAEEGMRFTNAFCTNSICSPSRATILTGTYSHVNGLYRLGQSFDTTHLTSTRVLHEAGYQTAVFGKWHLRCTPTDFDEYMVLPVQGRYQDPQFHEPGSDSLVTKVGWCDDIIADRTMEFLRNRDRDKPFFVMCQFKSTHDPWAARSPYDTLFSDEEMPVPDNLLDDYEGRADPARITTLKLEYMNQGTYRHHRMEGADEMTQREHIYQQYIRSFLQCGRVLDENVGRVLDFLEEEGLDEHTIVIYTADQGHFLGEHGFFSKRFMYEEAMRVPLIVRYPGHVEAGSDNSDLVANIDFAPTIISIAGLPVPGEMQGKSILPLLEGQTPGDWREAIYYRYWQHLLHRDVTAHYGIRTRTHKLIYFHGQPCGITDYPPVEPSWELYDLGNDPAEMHNLYGDPAQAILIKELKQQLLELKVQYGDTDEKYSELAELNKTHFW